MGSILQILASGLQIVLKALGMVHDAQEQGIGIQTQLRADLEASQRESVDAQKNAVDVGQLDRAALVDELRGPKAGS